VVDPALADRYRSVIAQVEEHAAASGRSPRDITTIVVTKFHPASLVRDLAELGHRHFGESRHQEASSKIAELADLEAEWHFIGQIQSNKARAIASYADVIHSLDSESVLARLAGSGTGAFIQVNLSDDPGRGGVRAEELATFTERVLATEGVQLLGVMGVARLGVEPRAEFATLRELAERIVLPLAPRATGLSMGMSGDFAEAIAEGATHLRIGTAITGNRPDPAYARQ